MRETRERFEAKFGKDGDNCWLWTGSLSRPKYLPRGQGYGEFMWNGTRMTAHRAAWQLYRGPIPAGKLVLHRCDVPACVNPGHLFVGTYQDNMWDASRKGRLRSRGRSPMLSESVRRYRERFNGGECAATLAREAGISRQGMWLIVTGKSYAWV